MYSADLQPAERHHICHTQVDCPVCKRLSGTMSEVVLLDDYSSCDSLVMFCHIAAALSQS